MGYTCLAVLPLDPQVDFSDFSRAEHDVEKSIGVARVDHDVLSSQAITDIRLQS